MNKMHNPYPHYLESEIGRCPLTHAAFSVLPVPYEKTVSYGSGTARGPEAILAASQQLETWDGHSNPSSLGIHTCVSVNCEGEAKEVIKAIAKATKNILDAKSIPVVLGGEHTVTYGVTKGFVDAGVSNLGVVQIDAHADLRDTYEGDPLSHASAMRRIHDMDIPLYQLGVRAYCEEEKEVRENNTNIYYKDADELVPNNIQTISLPDEFPENVYFTLDVDGLDPSVLPATGTPVPGGLGWYQTLTLFESIAYQRKIIGFDIMEFAPIRNFHSYDFTAALLSYKFMGIVQRTSNNIQK